MSCNTKLALLLVGLIALLVICLGYPRALYWFYPVNAPQQLTGEYKEIYFKAADMGIITIQLLFALNGTAATLLITCVGSKPELLRSTQSGADLKSAVSMFAWALLYSVLAAGGAYVSFFYSAKYDVFHNPGIWGACVFAAASAILFMKGSKTAAKSLFK